MISNIIYRNWRLAGVRCASASLVKVEIDKAKVYGYAVSKDKLVKEKVV